MVNCIKKTNILTYSYDNNNSLINNYNKYNKKINKLINNYNKYISKINSFIYNYIHK